MTLMRRHAVRRLPVVSDGRAIGMIGIGDLAKHHNPDTTFADISSAKPSPSQGTVSP
ncbi:CBS domain-containing protein [Streptomyces phaeochromogenes]|nr:CBS domain-containing protein [Streptomyces phaeochromogenes]